MTRLIIDSNFSSRGRFNNKLVDDLVDDVPRSVDIFVPIVVIWEWAEHSRSDINELLRVWNVSQRCAGLYPVDFPNKVPSIDELSKLIIDELPTRVKIWKPKADVFRDAVEAQVKQTGVAEKKSDVKTGAADHVVFACVREQVLNRDQLEPVILASSDKRLRAACEEEFREIVLTAGSRGQVMQRLAEFQPATEELGEVVLAELQALMDEELGSFPMGFSIVNRPRPRSETEVESLSVHRIDLVELDELEVAETSEQRRLGTAQVNVFGDVQLAVRALDEDGLGLLSTEESYVLRNVIIHAEVNLRFDDDWAMEDMSITESPMIELDLFEG